jgi:endo-1,4-beta-D-glucanase Y
VSRTSTLVLATGALVALVAVAAACGGSSSPRATPTTGTPAQQAAERFLRGYVDSSGRVVRHDQGGDTVSEGQAYAMLLDVATGDRSQFARVWAWSRANLMQPDGLLAYHWDDGRVLDDHSASDADLDVARALVLAGTAWHDATWSGQGKTYAAAILTNETAEAGGQLWLVAGPWARSAPYDIDPSYFDPATFALLARVTGDARWNQVAASSALAVAADTDDGKQLPSDWAQVSSSGQVQTASPPAGGAEVYGYDAFRTLIRQADACPGQTGPGLSADLLPLAEKTVSAGNRADTYNLNGTASASGDNSLMLIAAAGSARAAGDTAATTRYLGLAATAEARSPSYYLDAWVALGRYLLTTTALSACAP